MQLIDIFKNLLLSLKFLFSHEKVRKVEQNNFSYHNKDDIITFSLRNISLKKYIQDQLRET